MNPTNISRTGIFLICNVICTLLCFTLNQNELSQLVEPYQVYSIEEELNNDISRRLEFLDCKDLPNIEIVRELGKGKAKIVYEVKLPSGQIAIAKRCISDHCLRKGLLIREVTYLKGLQEQYGQDQVIELYGACDGEYPNGGIDLLKGTRSSKKRNTRYLTKIASNFNEGYTSFIELGKPFLSEWREGEVKFRKCFASFFTAADVESFRVIARQYAAYKDSPMVLGKPTIYFTDNIWVEQYILAKAGPRHVDLDMLDECKNCTYNEALKFNCAIVKDVVFQNDIDCSLAYSLDNPVLNFDDHINATEAELQCIERVGTPKIASKKK